jgi:hypothetical protein
MKRYLQSTVFFENVSDSEDATTLSITTISIMTLGITTLSIRGFFDNQHNYSIIS